MAARALHPEHYAPLSMAPELVKAHDALDREVDRAFGADTLLGLLDLWCCSQADEPTRGNACRCCSVTTRP